MDRPETVAGPASAAGGHILHEGGATGPITAAGIVGEIALFGPGSTVCRKSGEKLVPRLEKR
jgi:hypothetical protein